VKRETGLGRVGTLAFQADTARLGRDLDRSLGGGSTAVEVENVGDGGSTGLDLEMNLARCGRGLGRQELDAAVNRGDEHGISGLRGGRFDEDRLVGRSCADSAESHSGKCRRRALARNCDTADIGVDKDGIRVGARRSLDGDGARGS
jgi:hypothetical protein